MTSTSVNCVCSVLTGSVCSFYFLYLVGEKKKNKKTSRFVWDFKTLALINWIAKDKKKVINKKHIKGQRRDKKKNGREKKNSSLLPAPESDIQLIWTESCLAWQLQLVSVTAWTQSQVLHPSLKALSFRMLQRAGEVAAQKDPESKGGIEPGKQPGFFFLPPSFHSLLLFTSLSVTSQFLWFLSNHF